MNHKEYLNLMLKTSIWSKINAMEGICLDNSTFKIGFGINRSFSTTWRCHIDS